MYEPKSQRLKRVRSRISAENWETRVAEAKRAEKKVQQVEALMKGGLTLRAALVQMGGGDPRSSLHRWVMRYREQGLEGLVDARTPRTRNMTRECRAQLEGLRRADRKADAGTLLKGLADQGVEPLPSVRAVQRELRRIDDRLRYAQAKEQRAKVGAGQPEVIALPLAGAELLLAAELGTGVMGAVTDEIMALAQEAKAAAGDREPEKDTARRDFHGRFTAGYNAARARKGDEEIAGYLRPAAEKAKERVPTWARFVHEGRATIAAKVDTLTLSWAVAATKGWDSLRAPTVSGLEPLTGYAYMPSTLKKMTSALAVSGAGDRLLEAVGKRWHEVAKGHWGERGTIAALYVDNHAKEVWSSLFTKSGKVSHLNRVMPCITSTYLHTGAGAPIVASVQSGAAPLAPRLLSLVESTEKLLEEEVRRAVIIDAEGSTFDVLESFVSRNSDPAKSRIIVTPLRPSRAPELEIRHGPDSQYRPYRAHDELRIGQATLTHKSSGRTLEIGTLEVKREHRETDTILLTNGLALGQEGKDLADLYYARWPLQENFFKEAGPLGLAEHHSNCAEMVVNVAVESKLEKLGRKKSGAEGKLAELENGCGQCEREAREASGAFADAAQELAVQRRELDTLIAQGVREGRPLGQAAVGHQAALAVFEAREIASRKAQEKWKKLQARRDQAKRKVAEAEQEMARLQPLRKIRQIDVAADKILTASKLALSLLITFAIREFMPTTALSPLTFLSRIFVLRGRREIAAASETVVFYENPRDPEVTAAIRTACGILNNRRLQRDGRSLSYRVEAEPGAGAGSVDSSLPFP